MPTLDTSQEELLDTLSPWIFASIVACGFAAMAIIIGFDAKYWGDEVHFVATIRHFGQNFSFATFADYDQIAGPLVFALYGMWGKLVGFDIASLRYLNIAVSFAALILIFHWYAQCLPGKRFALLASLTLLLNPYLWGLGFFVFTDMPTLLFVVVMAIAVRWNRPHLLCIAGAAALLSRQYVAFIFLAAGCFYLVVWYNSGRAPWKMLFALALACIPLLILVFVWKGIAPPSGISRWVANDGRLYHPGYLTTYITFMAVYTLPLLLLMWRTLVERIPLIAGTLLFSVWYFIFPVAPSIATLTQTEHDTVGLAHRLIKYLFHSAGLDTLVLWFFFWCGLLLIANFLADDIKRIRQGGIGYPQFLSLAILSFLIVMPFSFQLWEKYLVIILPFVVLRSVMFYRDMQQGELNAAAPSF